MVFMDFEFRLWIKVNNKKVFGQGPKELLLNVKRLGSLRQATKAMDMSYSKAWTIIKKLEDSMNCKILDMKPGGTHGGGSTLTWEGEELLRKFLLLEEKCSEMLNILAKEIF
jgi:molybdate transport system regulatory protein